MMKKKATTLLAVLLMGAIALTGCSAPHTVNGSAEAVSVNGTSVPLGELNFYLRYQQIYMQNAYGGLFGENFMNTDISGSGSVYGVTMRDSSLETLEEYYLVEANAEELGISLTDEDESKIADTVQAFLAANDSKTLDAMTADEATVTHVLKLITLQQRVHEYFGTTIDTEVDPEEANQKKISYVLNSTEDTTDDAGNTVVLSEAEKEQKKADMEALLAEAKESGDLSAAAENYSLSVVPATYGKDDETLNADVYAAAEQLSDGEYSDVIESDNGYYVVYMESTSDADATQTKIDSILSDRTNEAYSAWLDPLKEGAEITVNDKNVEKLTFDRIYTVKAADEATADETVTDETTADETVTDEATTDETAVEDGTADDAATEEEAAEDTAAEE